MNKQNKTEKSKEIWDLRSTDNTVDWSSAYSGTDSFKIDLIALEDIVTENLELNVGETLLGLFVKYLEKLRKTTESLRKIP